MTTIMNMKREELVDRMSRLYGLENPIAISFARLCEEWAEGEQWDRCLEILVEAHEADPQIEIEWEA